LGLFVADEIRDIQVTFQDGKRTEMFPGRLSILLLNFDTGIVSLE